MFYEFKNQTDTGRELFVYGDIVGKKGYADRAEVDLMDFRDSLDEMLSGQHLSVYINSGGGSVFAASTMVSMLKRARESGIVVDAYIDGLAASAASFLALSADNVFAYRNSMMMVHKPMSIAFGNVNDMRHEIESLDSVEKNVMLPIYMARSKIGREDMQKLIDAETWLGADEIADVFSISVIDEEKVAAACSSKFFDRYRNTPTSVLAPGNRVKPPKRTNITDYSEYENRIFAAKGDRS